MALQPDHLPLPCSLRERVQSRFAPRDAPLSSEALTRDELIAYLGMAQDGSSDPMERIQRGAARAGRGVHLNPEDHAALSWVCKAFEDWEKHYPLESPLRDQVHRLLPLAAAMTLVDEGFFTVGAHPLHQLLDTLQGGSVGWQARLDRAGQMLEQRVERSVEKALEWFSDRGQDIAGIERELEAATERDAARAERMVQRLAETEEAHYKTLSARREAALRINALLEDFELPSAIGEFVKGPWYDSAQLVLVRHGEDSQEWQEMQRTTRHLMESVQPQDGNDDVARDRRAQMLRHLPGELRRWLISLEHDSDAADSAIGLVEYAHLRLQHGQYLDLSRIPLLTVEKQEGGQDATEEPVIIGDWYQFSDDDGELRAQLVLQLQHGQHLLFTNLVGLKALDLSRRAFQQRLQDGFGRLLPYRSTFSISLAAAAGIDSEEALRALVDPSYVPPTGPEAASAPAAEPPQPANSAAQQGTEPHWDNPGSAAAPENWEQPAPEPQPAPEEPALHPAPPSEAQTWDEPVPSLPADSAPGNAGQDAAGGPGDEALDLTLDIEEPVPPVPPAPPPPEPQPAAATPQTPTPGPTAPPYAPTPQPTPSPTPPQEPAPAPPPPAYEPAPPPQSPPPQQPQPAPPQAQPAPPPPPPAPAYSPPPPPPGQPPPAAPAWEPIPEQAPAPQPPPPVQPPAPMPPPMQPPATREVDVPMGAWLGFHDGETPIMAKLAVYDPRRDNYIFVNRKGIALRELSRSELSALMDQGLVDILETRSYFRDEVQRVRGEDR